MSTIKNGFFQRLFWLIVLTGTVPAAVSTTLPPTHWCLNFADLGALFELPSVGCFGGTSIAPEFLSPPFTWGYLALFCVGLIICGMRRQFLLILALIPFLLLFVSPVSELSVFPEDQITPDYFEPKSQQTASSIEKTLKEILPEIDLGTSVPDPQYSSTRNLLADAQANANAYWQMSRRIDQLNKKLETARKESSEASQFVTSAQASYDKMKQLGGMVKKTLKKLEELLTLAKENKKQKEKAVETIKKEIKALHRNKAATFSAFSSKLNELNAEVDSLLSSEPNQNIRIWTLAISASSLFALILFALGSHVRSLQFAIACLLVLVTAFNPVAKIAAGTTFSQGVFSLFLASYPVVLFIVTTISLRLMALAVIQNLPILRQFSGKKLIPYAVFSALRWIPVGICISIATWISIEVDTRAQDAVYGIGCTEEGLGIFQCDSPATETLVVRGEDSNLELDIYNSVDTAFKKQEQQIEEMLAAYRSLAKTSRMEIPKFVEKQFNAIFPDGPSLINGVPSLQAPDCKLYQGGCHVTRKVKTAIVNAYETTRDRQLKKLNELTSDLANLSGEEAEKRLRDVELYLSSALDATKRNVRNTIADIFWTVRSLNLLANLILILAAIKSFAYIFARVAFKSETEKSLPIEYQDAGTDIISEKQPDIRSGFDPEYVFRASQFGNYFIKPTLSPSGSSQGVAWPQPGKAVLRRLLSGTYKMIQVNHDRDNNDRISIQTSQGRQFLEWNLEPGERVYFSQGNLAAFSETIGLSTHISLSLTSMAFGRMFYSVAEGPGTLVLRTFGKPEIYTSGENARSIDPLRFIGWSDRARFHVNSSATIGNIYLHSAQISFSCGGAAIGDVSENGKRGAGAIRFIPPVFLPF